MPTKARTSKTHPLQIATIGSPKGTGRIGLTICPGKKDSRALPTPWNRDLRIDVGVIKDWGASAIVCLMEPFELKMLGVERLPAVVRKAGLSWIHLPIRDVDVPSQSFEERWKTAGHQLRQLLVEGKCVLVHCRGGLGRSGVVAARLLVELGMNPDDAIAKVRLHRPGAIETLAQESYVRSLRRPTTKGTPGGHEDRAIGCLLGLAIGDALGTTLEFSERDSLPAVGDLVGGGPFNLKAGEWTDDTSMALCLADSLLACWTLAPRDLMNRFRRWRDEGYNSVNGACFDIGITTSQALNRFTVSDEPLAGSTSPSSAGNGSIMRLAPIPIFYSANGELAEQAAVLQSRTTHGAAECLDACRLMTGIIVNLVNGVTWDMALGIRNAPLRSPKMEALACGAWKSKRRSQIKSTGYVVDTLEAALWAVDQTQSFSDAVLLAVNLGGDADTVGAVAGQLAGARYGRCGIPRKWLTRLAWSTQITHLALNLHRRGLTQAERPAVDNFEG